MAGACFEAGPLAGPVEQALTLLPTEFTLGDGTTTWLVDESIAVDDDAIVMSGAIVGSFEPVPAAHPRATDVALGPGRRVEKSAGLAVTLPEGWTSARPEPAENESELQMILGRLAPWRVSTGVLLIGPRPDHGDAPVEACVLSTVALADYMGSWDEASLESIAALADWVVASDDPRGTGCEPGSATYLDLPSGRMARLDYPAEGSHRSLYLLPQGKTLHVLVCEGPARSVDGWNSLAREIEVVPTRAR